MVLFALPLAAIAAVLPRVTSRIEVIDSLLFSLSLSHTPPRSAPSRISPFFCLSRTSLFHRLSPCLLFPPFVCSSVVALSLAVSGVALFAVLFLVALSMHHCACYVRLIGISYASFGRILSACNATAFACKPQMLVVVVSSAFARAFICSCFRPPTTSFAVFSTPPTPPPHQILL